MNSCEASELIFTLHGRVLRSMAAASGQHCSGLAQAARFNRQALGPRLSRRCMNLDTALALLRHITAVSAEEFAAEISTALTAEAARQAETERLSKEKLRKEKFEEISNLADAKYASEADLEESQKAFLNLEDVEEGIGG